MKLSDYQVIFIVVGLVGILLIASPFLVVIHLPGGQQFSELYILGPDQMADNYPSNIVVGQNSSVYLDVRNNLGSSAFYTIYVEFGNLTDTLPDPTLGTPSNFLHLYEYKFVVANGGTWESQFTFSVSNVSISGNYSAVSSLQLNGVTFSLDKPVTWDSSSNTYGCTLLFELWIYDSQSNGFIYNDRFVDLHLNLGVT